MKAILKVTAAVFVAAVLSAACSGGKAPAEEAIKAAQDAYAPVSADAEKYVPDQARAIQDSITSAQAAVTSGDYAGALQQAQAIPAKVAELGPAIESRKGELTTAWTEMSASMPKMIAALESRVKILGQSKSLPAGLTRETVDAAKSGVATASQAWSEATAAAQSGDAATAAAKGAAVQTQVMDLMKSLNMQVPGGN